VLGALQNDGPLAIVVADNFTQVVMDSDKDVLLVVHPARPAALIIIERPQLNLTLGNAGGLVATGVLAGVPALQGARTYPRRIEQTIQGRAVGDHRHDEHRREHTVRGRASKRGGVGRDRSRAHVAPLRCPPGQGGAGVVLWRLRGRVAPPLASSSTSHHRTPPLPSTPSSYPFKSVGWSLDAAKRARPKREPRHTLPTRSKRVPFEWPSA